MTNSIFLGGGKNGYQKVSGFSSRAWSALGVPAFDLGPSVHDSRAAFAAAPELAGHRQLESDGVLAFGP